MRREEQEKQTCQGGAHEGERCVAPAPDLLPAADHGVVDGDPRQAERVPEDGGEVRARAAVHRGANCLFRNVYRSTFRMDRGSQGLVH